MSRDVKEKISYNDLKDKPVVTNVGNNIDITPYTSATNPFVVPEDGYVWFNCYSSSSNQTLELLNKNNVRVDTLHKCSYPDYNCVFLKKGMHVYFTRVGGSIGFYPLKY